ncbi:AAA family ATPase [Arcicella rosea]
MYFFDEIQYLKDWERHLKVLVDFYPKTKFIVSGADVSTSESFV